MSPGDAPLSTAYRVHLGGFEFRLAADTLPLRPPPEATYRAFLAPDPFQPAPQVIAVRFTSPSRVAAEGRLLFASDAAWSLLADGDERSFVMSDPQADEPLYAARFRPGRPEVEVACSQRLVASEGSSAFVRSPFHYPLDQILVMYLLGASGLVLHAAGVVRRGEAVAFLGVSGAGKSTISALLGRGGWERLSDDRVILRRTDGQPRMWGTPWPGEAAVARNAWAPAHRLFFLEQGAADEARPISAGQAFPRLARTVSVPWFDPDYLGDGLAACDWVLRTLPASVFSFRPTAEAAEALERILDS